MTLGSGAKNSRGGSATALSRRLTYALRHAPHSLGLELDTGGWADVDDLLRGLRSAGLMVSRTELAEVVRTSDKQRFAYDATGTRIRANQGHSVAVDLQLEPLPPPPLLFHGTVSRAVEQICREGITAQSRHHVHLSPDVQTATTVGGRRGRPIVLVVDAAGLAATGVPFYRSANGVWLVKSVPPRFITIAGGRPPPRSWRSRCEQPVRTEDSRGGSEESEGGE